MKVLADSLISKPISLINENGEKLTPADSLYFSFYYQPQGNADAPESTDSLVLMFGYVLDTFRIEYDTLFIGDMLEYMEYAGELYGTPRSELLRAEREGRIPLLILDLVGVEALSKADGISPHTVYIFDEPEVLAARLAERYGTDSPKYAARVEQNARDAEKIDSLRHLFSAFVKNDTTPTACAEKIGLNYFSRL